MSSTHPINRTTDWYEAQVKHGNYDPIEPEVKQEDVSKQLQEDVSQIDPLAGRTLKGLEELEDEVDEDVLEKYRRKRLAELKLQKRRAKFGSVVQVGMAEYVNEITNASKGDEQDGPVLVICHLYKDWNVECQMMNSYLDQLAREHPEVKFCRGISDQLVPNFKDSSIPALLLYYNGQCQSQIIGTSIFGGEKRMSKESVEWVLAKNCHAFKTELLTNPLEGEVMSKGTKGIIARMAGIDGHSDEEEDDRLMTSVLHTGARDKGYSDTQVERVTKYFK